MVANVMSRLKKDDLLPLAEEESFVFCRLLSQRAMQQVFNLSGLYLGRQNDTLRNFLGDALS